MINKTTLMHRALDKITRITPTRCLAVLPPAHGYLRADRLVLAAWVAVSRCDGALYISRIPGFPAFSWWRIRPCVWPVRH